MTGIDMTAEFSEVVAWGLIAAVVVYAAISRMPRVPVGGAVALATLAALLTKAVLLPWV
jgi:hypothetical protein